MAFNKRRKYIVHPKFQLRFALGFIIAALIVCISSTVLFNYFAVIKLKHLQWSVHVSANSTGEVLKQLFLYIILFNFIFVSILFAITGFRMLKKIDGPINRLIKCLEFIKNGDLSKTINLRQEDVFNNIAGDLDDMREQIKNRFIDSKIQYELISENIQNIKKDLAGNKLVDHEIDNTIKLIQKLKKQNLLAQQRRYEK